MTGKSAAPQARTRPASAGFLLLIIACVFSGCATDWTQQDIRYELAFQVINAADAYTTSRIRHTPGVYESNRITAAIIGEQPSSTDTALLFITYGLSHYMISTALPEKWCRAYQVSTIAYSAYLTINNCNIGLC